MLGAMDALRDAGVLRELVNRSDFAAFPLQFELLAPTTTAAAILEAHNLDRESFERAAADAADVVWAILDGATEEQFLDLRASEDVYGEDTDTVEVASRKYRAAAEHFDMEALRRRYWLKNNAKAATISRFGWQLAQSPLADEGSPPGGGSVSFGILQIIGDPGPAFPDDTITLALDVEDVDYMVTSLTRLRDALRELSED